MARKVRHHRYSTLDPFLPIPARSIAQEERQYAIKSFKSGAKDVMVASGVASKGLDFNDIQHVIIFSMPKEIEDYVHQIGRTGRSGKTGIATTFVNMSTPEQTLLDLKYLLMEAGQKWAGFFFYYSVFYVTECVVRCIAESPRSCKQFRIHVRRKVGPSRDVRSVEVTSCSYSRTRVMFTFSRSRTRHLELSQVGGRATSTDGLAAGCKRRWRWILKYQALSTVHFFSPYGFMFHCDIQCYGSAPCDTIHGVCNAKRE